MHSRKRRGYARTTISLPWELRHKMKCHGDDFNWSAIAAEAFAHKMGHEQSERDDAGLDEVVERLKGTLPAPRGQLFVQGVADGEKWAREQASVDELRRLHAARRQTRIHRHGRRCRMEGWLNMSDEQQSPADALAKVIGQEKFPNSEALDKKQLESSEYVHGFAAGAIHLWKRVVQRMRTR